MGPCNAPAPGVQSKVARARERAGDTHPQDVAEAGTDGTKMCQNGGVEPQERDEEGSMGGQAGTFRPVGALRAPLHYGSTQALS